MSDKVLITGGAGFIGFHLAKKLIANNYRVWIVDNHVRGILDKSLSDLLSRSGATFINTDLLDRQAVMSLDNDFDAIYHLGAIIGVKNVVRQPYNVLAFNTRMLEHVFELAGQQKNLERLLFASTSEVYAGTLEYGELDIPTPESSLLTISSLREPRTSYMLSKIMCEAMLHQGGIPFTIFRPHNIYGPRMGLSHVIPEQLEKSYQANPGDKLGVWSPEHTRSFCYIDDAVAMLKCMMENDSCRGKTLNLGTQSPEVTIREVVELCIAVTGKNLGVYNLEDTSGSPARRAPDMSLTTKLLNYESKVGLREGVSKTWDWYRENIFEGNGLSSR